MKIEMMTTFTERFELGEKLWLEGEWRKITWVAWHKGQVRVRLEGITSPEAVDLLRGKKVEVDEDDRPDLDEDEFYVGDLIGMTVFDQNGVLLGPVTNVLTYPAQDILEVGKVLIPFVEEFVELVDFDTETIKVTLIPGMMGEDEDA
jgi:16S rRNA processing protein RimM